jgi:hypothetical protein
MILFWSIIIEHFLIYSEIYIINEKKIPYVRYYKPRLVYFLPHFSLRNAERLIFHDYSPRFTIESGFKSRAGYNGAGRVCTLTCLDLH